MLPDLLADPLRFETVFDLLSLDLCAASFAPMNLVEPSPGALRSALRGAMSAPSYTAADQPTRLSLVARAFEVFPADYLARFVAWSRREFQYDPADDHGIFFWRQILHQAAYDGETRPWTARAARSLRDRLDVTPLPDRTPTTEWDSACLAAHRARHGDTPMSSPVEFVIATIHHVTFARAWEEALRSEPDREAALTQALTWARRRAPAIELPEEMLTDPRTWPPLLTSWT